jgi:HTH DNA binding domain
MISDAVTVPVRIHAYKAMAWLGEVDATGRSTAEAVEEALYRHRQPLFGAVSIAFFDTTSLWFEGAGADSVFLAACVFRGKGPCPIALPFWSAPEQRHYRLGLKIGVAWIAEFLECVTAAAAIGLRELERLRAIENKARSLGRTARSRLPAAIDAALRAPIVTAGSLAKTLDVTPQAAAGLLRQLETARFVREATGRASWRAFALMPRPRFLHY